MAKVILAGYQIDAEVIDLCKKAVSLAKEGKNQEAVDVLNELKADQFTPEVIAAAYARISRDPRDIPELRRIAREDVESAKKSNKNILFGQGHKAVADGFIFNYDILGLSRLAVEEIEARRIGCGYIEKSQRYITLDGDFVIPSEFSKDDAEKYKTLVQMQCDFYNNNLETLIEYQKEINPELVKEAEELTRKGKSDKMNAPKNRYEGLAKEDARYGLGLGTITQAGVSYTARTAEHTIRTLRYSQLMENKELCHQLFEKTAAVAPSLIALADPELFRKEFGCELIEDNYAKTRPHLKKLVTRIFEENSFFIDNKSQFKSEGNVKLIEETDFDTNILAALLFANSNQNVENCYRLANYLVETPLESREFIKDCLRYVSEFDAVPREFEQAGLIFEAKISSSCFAQLKRHRLMTLLAQDYNPALSYTIPESVSEINASKELTDICDESSKLYYEFKEKYGKAAEYCLTNAHRRNVLVATNMRELYHISRMREDLHAQWDIRDLASYMSTLAKEKAPLTSMLLGGKSQFKEIRKKMYEK